MHKRINVVLWVIILCFLVCALIFVLRDEKYTIELLEDDIGYIEVWDGLTGESQRYLDRDDIHDIISCFNGVLLERGHEVDHSYNGSLYRIDCFSYGNTEESPVFSVIIKDMEHIQISELEFPFDTHEIVDLLSDKSIK